MMTEPSLTMEQKTLFQPDYKELASVLGSGLSKFFLEYNIEIVDCPDLTEEPFFLARPGLGGGNISLVDVGGPPYLLPTAKRDKIYDIRTIKNMIDFKNDAFFVGAGAGPWPYANTNCEGIFNVAINDNVIDNQSRIAKISEKTGTCVVEQLPNSETRFAVLGNFFVSEGKPSKVLKLYCKNKLNGTDFITSVRQILTEEFCEGPIGLGGALLINAGKAKHHVMPDFSTKPINNVTELNEWLNFYDFSAPLVSLGTIITDDLGLDLRLQHFHSFSKHNEGGHFHHDTTPAEVEYLGYFNVAKYLYRIDQPAESSLGFGKD